MSGGVGSRFWPMSRSSKPKQFLDILGTGRTLLQMTIDRFSKFIPIENIIVVTAAQYKDLTLEQIPNLPEENILLEPYKRNTAPCIAYASYKLFKHNPNATVVVSPADHLIVGDEAFSTTIQNALSYAKEHDHIFTIAVKPTFPNTNYGYIQADTKRSIQIGKNQLYGVTTFTEKPDYEMAQLFIDTGEFYWNSGMFIWNVKTIIRELEQHLPEVSTLFSSMLEHYFTDREQEHINRIYADSTTVSIDYGLMEKTTCAWTFIADFNWCDIGTWSSLYDSFEKDNRGNAIKCSEGIFKDMKNCIVHQANNEKLVFIKGLEEYMVVDTNDVLMICPRTDAAVKEVLSNLALEEKREYL